jgi:Flp pilus assembly protein TadG
MKIKRLHTFHRVEKGQAAVEAAIVLPVFFAFFFLIFAFAIWFYSLYLSSIGVAAGARQAGVTNGTGPGYAVSRQVMSVMNPSASASGSVRISMRAPGCQRAVYARLNAAPSMRIPFLGNLAMRLRAGSVTRVWKFWAGRPEDGCE